MYNRNRSIVRRAFSLVELMIVVAIIGILATAVTVNVRGYLIKARQNVAMSDIATICDALETFFGEYGRYPTEDEGGLAALTRTTDEFPDPLIGKMPLDPWRQPYRYVNPAPRQFEVICLGADAAVGGSGADRDISSKDLRGGNQQ